MDEIVGVASWGWVFAKVGNQSGERGPKHEAECRWLPDISAAIMAGFERDIFTKSEWKCPSYASLRREGGARVRAVHFLLGSDALCFHAKRRSSLNNSIPSVRPPNLSFFLTGDDTKKKNAHMKSRRKRTCLHLNLKAGGQFTACERHHNNGAFKRQKARKGCQQFINIHN